MSEENQVEYVGDILESLRKRKGLTQEETAEWLGVTRHTYSDWERGIRLPSPKWLKRIANKYQLSQDEEDALYRAAAQEKPKIRKLPFPRNSLFTGREAQLEQLKQSLQENGSVALTQRVSISGLGGIGKTQLALEYAYCHYPDVYRTVLWVNAADETVLDSYVKLAEFLELPDLNEREPKRSVQAVKEWLERHTNWLLIMDNADNLQLARSFFPDTHQGHILLITRSQMAGDVAAQVIELDKMELDEGLRFLLRRTRKLKIEDPLDTVAADIHMAALEVVELLDRHPLALDQAGAYIEDDPLVSFADYINLYHEKRHDLLSERGSLDSDNEGKYSYHPETVVVTFELCFEKAQNRHPLATDILCFCSCLFPDDIPNELFQHDDTFNIDKTALRKGIIALLHYSLLKPNDQEKTYSMHRLVQAVLIDAMPPDVRKLWRERAVTAVYESFPAVDFTSWRQCSRLLPHALVCATRTDVELSPEAKLRVAVLLRKTGSYLYARGQYSAAEMLLKHVLPFYEQHFGVGHPATASLLNDLAALYTEQGHYGQAVRLYEQALAIYETLLGAEHPNTAVVLNNLAIICMNLGMYDHAESLLERVLSFRESHLGSEHPDTASVLNNLARLYVEHGRYEQAELFYRRALKIWEEHLVADNPTIALPVYGLAILMERQGQHDQAEAMYQRALSIQEKHLGAAHPETQKTKEEYAAFLHNHNIGRDTEAPALQVDDEPSV